LERFELPCKHHAASFTFEPSVMLAIVSPGPPMPKLTVNCAGLPREVERTAVIW